MPFRESKLQQWILILGLGGLFVSIFLSLNVVKRLEDAVHARKVAYEVRGSLDSINEKIKDWALLKEYSKPNRSELFDEINREFDAVAKTFAPGGAQIKLLNSAREKWKIIAENPGVEIKESAEIDELFEQLDLNEAEKISLHEPDIIRRTGRLVIIVTTSAIIAALMIVYALFSRQRQNARQSELLQKMQTLQKDAEMASQLKSKFLATVSHEIRTPLNGIIGLSDILRARSLPSSEKKFIEVINQSGKTLLRIINDILDFSKIEAGHFDLQYGSINIGDIVEQVLSTLNAKANQKGLLLSKEIDPKIPRQIRGDSDRLAQVLFNIIGNALKFTSNGGVKVKLGLIGRYENNRCKIRFSVSDSGIGLSEDQLKNLFLPFVQLQGTGTSGEEGTGLGLSISQHLVQAMGGKIEVESKENQGSTFWFDLNFAECSKESLGDTDNGEKKFELHDPSSEILSTPNQRWRALVVEDNPTNQIVLQAMLEQIGGNSTLAANGLEAIQHLERSEFDIILMDIQMPIMDGLKTTELIRSKNIMVPIIALTANASLDDQNNCRAAGMNGFLAKPVTLSELQTELDPYISSRPRLSSSIQVNDLASKVGNTAALVVLRSFLDSLNDFRKLTTLALSQNDLGGLHRVAHRFKSSAKVVGATAFSNACQELEDAKTWDLASNLAKALLTSLDRLEISFKKDIAEFQKSAN